MTSAGRCVGAVAALVMMTCAATVIAVAPAAARTLGPPRLSASPSTVRPGEVVTIGAYDLDPLTDYQVQVCGNDGFGGSSVCNLASTFTAATSETGGFRLDMKVLRPPLPCPCVVQAIPLDRTNVLRDGEVSTPINIFGMPIATPIPPPVGRTASGLVVVHAELAGSKSWPEWFGGSAHRTLVLVLRDVGPNIIPSTPFVLRSGPASDPNQVVDAPYVPPLRPGQQVSYRVPVSFPPLAHGNYVVVGHLGSTDQVVTFTATTQLMPWGLVMVLALVVLVILGLLIWRFVRRRQDEWTDEIDGTETPGETSETAMALASISEHKEPALATAATNSENKVTP